MFHNLPLPRPITVVPQEQGAIGASSNARQPHVRWQYRHALLLLILGGAATRVLVILHDAAVAARAAAPHEPIHRAVAHPNVPDPGPLENCQLGGRVESFALRGQVAVALLSGLDEDLLLVLV